MSKALINQVRFRLKGCFEKKSLKRGGISFAVGFGVFGFFSEQIHFIKSLTDSLPEHYFVHLPKRTPKMGDLTVVNNQFYGSRLIKKIIGQAGDQVSTDTSGDLWVGRQLVGKVYPQTGDGRKLIPFPEFNLCKY